MAKWQLLIRKQSKSETDQKQVQFGDIVAAVDEKHVFSKGELLGHFVLVVDGLDPVDVNKLTSCYYENGVTDPINEWDHAKEGRPPKLIAKRKYQIPLEKMEAILPTFDKATADTDANYQPFTDADVTVSVKQTAVIYDKCKADYVTSFASVTGDSTDG